MCLCVWLRRPAGLPIIFFFCTMQLFVQVCPSSFFFCENGFTKAGREQTEIQTVMRMRL